MKAIIPIILLLLSGCTDAYYQSQSAYYNAQAAAIAAQKPLPDVVRPETVNREIE